MTAASFAAFIEEAEPLILTASHYDLVPDAFGLGDGCEWAFSGSRVHLPDGGEWPYYIAAIPSHLPAHADVYTIAGALNAAPRNPNAEKISGEGAALALAEGRVLETYCEGDLTAYIFATHDEREQAADAWQESEEEYAARLIADCAPWYPTDAASIAPALIEDLKERFSGAEAEVTPETVSDAMERYEGCWGSEADYWREFQEGCMSPEQRDAMGSLYAYVDWHAYARDARSDGYIEFRQGGHAFRAEV